MAPTEPTVYDAYDSSRGTRVAPLLQPSPQGDLKISTGKPASPSPAIPSENTSARPSVQALIERWSQPNEPLQLTKIAAGQLGKRANQLTFTADGQLLYVGLHQEGRHLLFQTKDGKKVLDVEYGNAPLSSSNITPDGKYLLATRGAEGVGVWEIATKKEIFLHNRMVHATTVLATQAEASMVASALPDGGVCLYPLLGGRGKEWNCREALAGNSPTSGAEMQLTATADGAALFIFDPGLPNLVHWAYPDGQTQNVEISTSAGGPVAAGTRVFAETLTPGQFRMTSTSQHATRTRYHYFKSNTWGSRVVSVSPDDAYAANLRLDKELLDIVSCRTGIKQSKHLPVGVRGYLGTMHWGTSTIATADHEGGLNLFRFQLQPSRAEEMMLEVERCLADKDDERLEQLAAELETETVNFPFDGIDSTKYHRLVQTLVGDTDLLRSEDTARHYQEWLTRNPTSKLARICRVKKLMSEGWAARGGGYAASVTTEGWRVFDQKTREAETILETFTLEDRIPGEAFAQIFSVAMAQNWPEQKTKPYVERLFKDAPRDVRAHGERIQGLLPRWGGGPDDCREYAERVAAEIGGADGDAMYANLVVSLMNFADHGIAGQLGFDPIRFQAGLDHRFRDDRDNAQYWQLAVMLAAIAGDQARTHEFALKIATRRDPYAGLYCSERIFDELLQTARQFNPGRQTPKANLQPLTPAL